MDTTNTSVLRRSPRKKLKLDTVNSLNNVEENADITFETDEQKVMVPYAGEQALNITTCKNCDIYKSDIQILITKIEELTSQNTELIEINENLKIINNGLSMRIFSYENISKDDDQFRSFTGIEKCKYEVLYEYLNPGENRESIKFYDKNITKTEEKVSKILSHHPHFLALDQSQAQNQS